jgi:hypothetical protein
VNSAASWWKVFEPPGGLLDAHPTLCIAHGAPQPDVVDVAATAGAELVSVELAEAAARAGDLSGRGGID